MGIPLESAIKAVGISSGVAKAPSVKRRLRLALERALIPRALKAQLDLPAQLSNSAILQERRDRYGDVLRAVRRDYG